MSSFHTGALLCSSIRLSSEWLCHRLRRLSCSWHTHTSVLTSYTTGLCGNNTSLKQKGAVTLTLWGLTGTRSKFMFMPGMTTVIFRGPLNPRTLVSCQQAQRVSLHIRNEQETQWRLLVGHSRSRWRPAPAACCSPPAEPRGSCRGWCRCRRRWIWCPWGWTCSGGMDLTFGHSPGELSYLSHTCESCFYSISTKFHCQARLNKDIQEDVGQIWPWPFTFKFRYAIDKQENLGGDCGFTSVYRWSSLPHETGRWRPLR